MPSDRSVLVRIKGDISDFNRAMVAGSAGAKAFTDNLDTSTDRMQNMVQTALALGPALVPISAAAVPAIAGLSNQLAFATAGAGVAALAFQGVGDALKATNDYALEPSNANFEKMQQTLATLGPEGQHFVAFLQDLRPQMQALQDAAQAGLFPGLESGLTDIMDLLPNAERIITQVAGGLGQVVAEAGDNLNDPRWRDFFTFLETEARPTLVDMGRTLGNFAEGFANLWMAFDPLADDFSSSFLQLSRDFAKWTDGLSQTDGFREFVDYVTVNGPRAFDALTSLANALLQIVEAAAPVGEVMLPILTTLFDVIGSIADSPIGPVLIGAAAGISAISRAVALYNTANGSAMSQMLAGIRGTGPYLNAAAAGVGIFALSLTDLDEKLGVSHTATLGLAGAVAGPWGAAAGLAVGATLDLAAANDDLWSAVSKANAVVNDSDASLSQQSAALAAARKEVFELQDTLSGANGISLGSIFSADKNALEGLFGRSDAEEAADALAKLEDQQAKNVAAAREQQFAEAGLSISMAGASDATREQTSAVLDLITAHNKLTDETLAAADANIAYEQALDDAAKAGREGKDGLDANTQAGRDNLTLLTRLAGSWNNLSAEQQNAKGASERARSEFIAIAIQMGATRKRAKELADEYLDIPTDVSTNVKSNAPKVTKQVRDLIAALQEIPGVTETTIRTIKETYLVTKDAPRNSSLEDMLGLKKERKAYGGEILGPGGPRDDLIPVMASNKEIMVNAFDAQEHRALLLGINAGRFRGMKPEFRANGGEIGGPRLQRMVDGGSVRSASSTITAGPLVARLVDPTVRVHKDGLIELMDRRVEVGNSQANDYRGN